MNEEQSNDFINILTDILTTLKEHNKIIKEKAELSKLDKINKLSLILKEIIPDKEDKKIEGKKTIIYNKGYFERKKVLKSIMEIIK